MKILILTTHANTGGITSYIFTLSHALIKSGHEVWVVSHGGNCVEQMQQIGIKHVQINVRTKSEAHPMLWLNLGKLNDLVKKEGIDIIHAQTRVMQVLGTALSTLSGVKLVTTCHGFFRPRWLRRTFPCWGEGVIAISKPVAEHLHQDFKVPRERIYQITNGVDLDLFQVANDQSRQEARKRMDLNGGPIIGIIARLSSVKGIDVLIKALALVLERIPSARLVIVGQGPEEANLKQVTADLKLTGKVQFINIVNQPEILLPGFDLFVMPSLMEGLGLSVMEAQACGIPVVASRIGGLIDLIQDGVSGFLVSRSDPQALGEAIMVALKNPETCKIIAQVARKNMEQHFSAEQMAQKTLEMYEQYSRS